MKPVDLPGVCRRLDKVGGCERQAMDKGRLCMSSRIVQSSTHIERSLLSSSPVNVYTVAPEAFKKWGTYFTVPPRPLFHGAPPHDRAL